MVPEVQQARADRREARLAALEPEFYEPDFDAVLNELQKLPARFDEAELEPIVEARAGVLEVIISAEHCQPPPPPPPPPPTARGAVQDKYI